MIDIEKVKGIIKERTKIGTMSRDYGHTVDDVSHIESPYELKMIESAITELDRLQQNQLTLNRYLELEAKGINISKIEWDEKKKMLHILQTNKEMLRSDK